MTIHEDVYQPPAVIDEPLIDPDRLSKDEWLRVVRIFIVMVLLLCFFCGLVLTVQTSYALRAFNAEGHIAGIVAVSTTREIGPRVVLIALWFAFVAVVRKRAKANVPPPRRGLFGPMFLIAPLMTPIAGSMMTMTSVLMLMAEYDQALGIAWKSILNTLVVSDIFIGMLVCGIPALIHAAFATKWARLIVRKLHRPNLSYLGVWFIGGWSLYIWGSIVWRVVYYIEFGDDPEPAFL